ncbi:tRNA uridine-5-carboxymethylaminomethyl(34) synthesis GTPase MnmE [Deinococcus sp. KNUC1210]|uniref:tRNA uridine-5-carboxymethylaminomethyl(34) synthesis GTPase MnmE n=1 Tax=Deinococcus sp. KNUC1210 TaxID=2917691 RepID=UPI001EF09B30|nr:tRNA uridine-5-carboxymethylaminomethyl(34) synthesis GTPase MnmE [Deinococcus sp. KNUC1210]ULH15473.1 tRNA uridine-5-carboxymethylaminomethyl(34) synthesis GTPase MnmE [Deinococcus sp. KNUC1210]
MTRLGLSDTIAAVATAPGSAGVGIVRVSGPDAHAVAGQVFQGRHTPAQTEGGRFLYGHFSSPTGERLDDGLCLVFRAPHSYTGEDVVELQSHGSPAVLRSLLAATLAAGARPARPGEFTLRAYLAGRMDLTQAESVLNLVNAQGEIARRQATLGLSGALSQQITAIQQDVTRTLSAVQAMLDYPEEGVPQEEREEPLRRAEAQLSALIDTGRAGQVAAQGARLALIGAPNAGKSSLLNALLGYERSIVTAVPGTTRDYLEATMELAGVPITLVDTAGLRDTLDTIEAAGVQHARVLAGAADLVLRLEDGSGPREALEGVPDTALLVQTKADLGRVWHDPAAICVSAVSGEGLPELREHLRRRLLGDAGRQEVWLGSQRQIEAARRALAHLRAAHTLPDDLAGYELEEALYALAEITGRDVQEDVIDGVFRNFCVGK